VIRQEQEDKTIVNIYAMTICVPKFIKQRIKKQLFPDTVIVGETPHSHQYTEHPDKKQ
jgi:hypothetical protein